MDRQNHFIDFERLFWKLSRKMEYQWNKIYMETFPGSQSHIMFLLQQNGPKMMSELAEALHLTAGAVTTASNHLINHGHIARIRDDKDRRVVRLDLTEKGRKTLHNLQTEGQKIMKIVFGDISDTELEMLIIIFNRANKNIDHMPKVENH